MDPLDELEIKLLDTALFYLRNKQGTLIDALTDSNQVRSIDAWLEDSDNGPLHSAVNAAFMRHNVEEEESLRNKLVQSMRYKLFEGTTKTAASATLPVNYFDDPNAHNGVCGNMQYIEERGCWDCRVRNKQQKADAWHQNWGYSPACPFWTPPDDHLPEAVNRPQDVPEYLKFDKE